MNKFTTILLFGVMFYFVAITMACPPCIPEHERPYYQAKGECLDKVDCNVGAKRRQGDDMKRSADQKICPPCIPYHLRSYYKTCPESPLCAKLRSDQGKVKRGACPPCIPEHERPYYQAKGECLDKVDCNVGAKRRQGDDMKRSADQKICPPCIPYHLRSYYKTCPESPICAKMTGGEEKVKRSVDQISCPPCIPYHMKDSYKACTDKSICVKMAGGEGKRKRSVDEEDCPPCIPFTDIEQYQVS